MSINVFVHHKKTPSKKWGIRFSTFKSTVFTKDEGERWTDGVYCHLQTSRSLASKGFN